MSRWCVHCDLDLSRRANGLCDPCNTYLAKYGERPPAAVVARRTRRREERRLERLASLQ